VSSLKKEEPIGFHGSATSDFLIPQQPMSRTLLLRCGFVSPWMSKSRRELKEIGWTKGRELAKLARAEGQRFDCAPWVHKARSMAREDFTREVDRELTGRETELHEIIYFRLYKSQIPVIEQALETAALMLGTDKSHGY
jgi:hypothetical protein